MRRYLPVVVVVLVIVIAVVWIKFGRGPATPPQTSAQPAPAQPLLPQPEYLKTVDQFMAEWAKANSSGMYALLADSMKKVVTEADFAKQAAEVKLSNPRLVAHTGILDTAYVIERVDAPQPKDATPINGYSLLLKKQGTDWRVALFVAEEQVAGKYTDLKLVPGKDKGYVVTWQDEKGQIATVTLQEL